MIATQPSTFTDFCKMAAAGGGADYTAILPRGSERQRVYNSLSSQLGSAGEFTIPVGISEGIEYHEIDASAMRQVCKVDRAETGATHQYVFIDDTANTGAVVGESVDSGDLTTEPVIEQRRSAANKFRSLRAKVPSELLEDSALLESGLAEILGGRLGRIQNTRFTTGDAGGTPQGVVPGCVVGKTAAAAGAFTIDELYDLVASVPDVYRRNARWMFHSDVWLFVKKLKDGQGNYLFKAAGLDEWPVTINVDMSSSLTTGEKVVLFGDFASAYRIRDVREVEIVHYDELYRENDESGFEAFHRADGFPMNKNAVKSLQLA